MKKKLTAVAIAAAAVAVLAGCNSTDASSDSWEFRSINAPDGREVPCVMYMPGNKTGMMSCDWANAKKVK